MKIKKILDSGTAANITVSLEDLNEFVTDLLREREAEPAMLRVENGEGERYLSLKETARIMNVSNTSHATVREQEQEKYLTTFCLTSKSIRHEQDR